MQEHSDPVQTEPYLYDQDSPHSLRGWLPPASGVSVCQRTNQNSEVVESNHGTLIPFPLLVWTEWAISDEHEVVGKSERFQCD